MGIPAYNWWNEALHGVARAGIATSFPQAIGMAAMFDDEHLERVGDVGSTEGRAKYNAYAAEEDRDIYNAVLGDYQALYEDAQNNVSDVNSRYAKFAAAEAELLSSAVIMPNTTDGGGYAISRIIPRTNQRTFFGTDDSRFKYMVLVDKALTVDERQEVLDDWDAKYAEFFSEEN